MDDLPELHATWYTLGLQNVIGDGVHIEYPQQTVNPALLQDPVAPVVTPSGQFLSVPCPVPGCAVQVPTVWSGFVQHMRNHKFLNLPDSNEHVCIVPGCECRHRDVRKGQTCQEGPHSAHVADINLHVWDHHMRLIWPCPMCGNTYSAERSMKRHLKVNECAPPPGIQICGTCQCLWSAGHACALNNAV